MKKSKLSKRTGRAIIIAAVIGLVAIAVFVANLFIPIKYLSAYIVRRLDPLEENSARVTFVDVGHGDCVIVELPDGETMLIDGGDGRYSNQLTVLKELNRRGIADIDYLVCTSVKSEHCGGLAEVIKYKNVNKIYLPYCLIIDITSEYSAFIEAAEGIGASLDYIEFGVTEGGAGWSFSFLSPSVREAGEGSEYYDLNHNPTDENINRASAVMWLDVAGAQFLFLSDTTSETCDERFVFLNEVGNLDELDDLYSRFGIKLSDCDVIMAAMHGAEDGVNEALYEAADPEITVISVGDNGEDAPSISALAAAQNDGGALYRTDRHGTVTMTVNDGNIAVA